MQALPFYGGKYPAAYEEDETQRRRGTQSVGEEYMRRSLGAADWVRRGLGTHIAHKTHKTRVERAQNWPHSPPDRASRTHITIYRSLRTETVKTKTVLSSCGSLEIRIAHVSDFHVLETE